MEYSFHLAPYILPLIAETVVQIHCAWTKQSSHTIHYCQVFFLVTYSLSGESIGSLVCLQLKIEYIIISFHQVKRP